MLNQVQIIGNVGADPDIRDTSAGEVASWTVAVNEKFKNRDGATETRTEWVRVTTFSQGLIDAVIKRHLAKGALVFCQGKLQTRKYQDQNGIDRWSTEVVIGGYDGKLRILGGRNAR